MISTMMTSKSKIGMMTKKPEHSGLLVIDKPQGVTSHDVVAAVRGALHMKRVGHAGTLDPMATGVPFINVGRMYYFSLKTLPKRMPRDCSTTLSTITKRTRPPFALDSAPLRTMPKASCCRRGSGQ